ncbi:hypothetical protein L2E82_40112 [Cichorium intybus]|uniref:Uncharacterized protein n=1 Tax=Cichorium intybus TaxID=13427 RepID=A0ACB9AL33_CICIN|nr:hypothetical protein L2E82_40112 [Cichorium intybus]
MLVVLQMVAQYPNNGRGGGVRDFSYELSGVGVWPSYLTNYTPSPHPPPHPSPHPPPHPIPSLFFFNTSFYSQKLLESLLPRPILRKKGGLSSLHVSR